MELRHFQLKPSRLAYVFQLSIYAVLMLVLYQLLPLGLWLIALVAGFCAVFVFSTWAATFSASAFRWP